MIASANGAVTDVFYVGTRPANNSSPLNDPKNAIVGFTARTRTVPWYHDEATDTYRTLPFANSDFTMATMHWSAIARTGNGSYLEVALQQPDRPRLLRRDRGDQRAYAPRLTPATQDFATDLANQLTALVDPKGSISIAGKKVPFPNVRSLASAHKPFRTALARLHRADPAAWPSMSELSRARTQGSEIAIEFAKRDAAADAGLQYLGDANEQDRAEKPAAAARRFFYLTLGGIAAVAGTTPLGDISGVAGAALTGVSLVCLTENVKTALFTASEPRLLHLPPLFQELPFRLSARQAIAGKKHRNTQR